MITVALYTRQDCHLCHQAEVDLYALQREFPHSLELIDVDSSLELQRQFGFEVPVVEIGGHTLKAPFSRTDLRAALAQAIMAENPNVGGQSSGAAGGAYQPGATWSRSDDFTVWFSKHYLAIINLLVGIYVFLPFLAPVFMKAGFDQPAYLIYKGYSTVCHQLAFRSFFLFGEQPVYPRAAAGLDGYLTYGEATNLSEGSTTADLLAARNFLGTSTIGYKIALCERDVAIYGSILLFGLVFAASARRIKPLPWYLWLLIGILPIALDGVSQLISQPPIALLPYRESTPLFRVLTGALFGFTTAWFGIPLIDQTMSDTLAMMAEKKRRIVELAKRNGAPEPAD